MKKIKQAWIRFLEILNSHSMTLESIGIGVHLITILSFLYVSWWYFSQWLAGKPADDFVWFFAFLNMLYLILTVLNYMLHSLRSFLYLWSRRKFDRWLDEKE